MKWTTEINIKPSPKARRVESFGALDRKARVIGVVITTWESDFQYRTEEEIAAGYGSWGVPPGHYYNVIVQAARNGNAYGASQPTKHFLNAAERDAYIELRIRQAAVKAAVAAERQVAR